MFGSLLRRAGSETQSDRSAIGHQPRPASQHRRKGAPRKRSGSAARRLLVQSLEDRRLLAVLDPIETVAIGTAYEDSNANGFRDAGEMGLNGVFVDLVNIDSGGRVIAGTADVDLNADGSIDPAGETGVWQFANFSIGDQHDVRLIEAPGSAFTTAVPPVFQLDQPGAVVSRSGQASEFDLPELVLLGSHNIGVAYEGSIHGLKFEDLNGNGSQDPGEPGLSNITFELTGRDALGFEVGPLQATTNANGEFEFVGLFPSVAGQVNPNAEFDVDGNLIAATGYTITELPTPGFAPTTPTVFTTDLFSGQELVWQSGAANLPAAPVALIDQVQLENEVAGSTVINQTLAAQIFQPDVTGNLLRVDLRLTAEATTFILAPGAQPATGVRLEVQTIDQFGMPSGAAIGRADLTATEVTAFLNSIDPLDGEIGLVSFDFSGAPLAMLEDADYALVLSGSQTLATTYRWAIDSTDPYDRGRALTSFDLGANYNEFNVPTDHAFRTVMIPFADPREEVFVGTPLVFGNIDATSLVTGRKIFDVNGNGIPELGELGLAGIEIALTGTNILGQPVNLITTTDADGNYQFDNLVPSDAAGYTVTEANTFDYVSTGADDYTFVVVSRTTVFGADFSNTLPASVHGFKFLDVNNNGVYDPNDGESGLPGIQFRLTGIDGRGETIEQFATTDEFGEFDFEGLFPSVIGDATSIIGVLSTGYTVEEVLPPGSGYTPSTTTAMAPQGPFSLAAGVEIVAFAGQSTVLFDTPQLDQDQPQVDSSVGVTTNFYRAQTFTPGVTGLLTEATVLIEPTDADSGVGQFDGDVVLQIQETTATGEPSGVIVATATILNADLSPDRVNATFDFSSAPAPLLQAGTSYALVLNIANTTSGFISLSQTSFDSYPDGSDYLTQDDGNTWTTFGNSDFVFSTTMREQLERETVLGEQLFFGNTVNGSLHGFKFEDIDGNGAYDGGPTAGGVDVPLAGVTFVVEATLANGVFFTDEVTTDGNGRFDLTDLPPSIAGVGLATGYTLTETVPNGFLASTPTSLQFDLESGVALVFAVGASGIDPNDPLREEILADSTGDGLGDELIFGNYVPGSFHGFKFEDIDGNGAYDPAIEVPQSGVQFRLTDVNGFFVNDVFGVFVPDVLSDGNGEFAFENLVPGTYLVTEILPVGFVSTTPELERMFTINSRQELVWQDGAANLPDLLPPAIDQSLDGPINLNFGVGAGGPAAQTFTPANTGSLLNVVIESGALTNVDVTVEIQSVDLAGAPSGTVLATATVSSAGAGPLSFDFATPPTLTAGEAYAIVIEASDFWALQGNTQDLYPGGSIFESPDGGTTWNASISGDLLFSTTVQSADPREELLIDPDANGIWEALVWGNTAPGSIHGFKFEDVNNDGVFEDGVDIALDNVEFVLTGFDGAGNPVGPITDTTEADGRFDFVGLLPGQYTVTENNTNPFLTPTTPIVREFTITSGQEYVWVDGAAGLPDRPDPQVDQTQLTIQNISTGSVTGATQTAQTFVPGVSGDLTQVDIEVNSQGTPADVTMQLQSVDEFGQPSGTVLATSTILAADIAVGTNVPLSFDFSAAPVPVFQGNAYALVLSRPAAGGFVDWWVAAGAPYADGIALSSGNSGTTWFDNPEFDHNFSTEVQPFGDPRFEVLVDTSDAEGLLYGNTVAGSLHGFKFEDIDGNSIYDGGVAMGGIDVPLAGVTFTLTGTLADGTEVVRQATSEADGSFEFLGLPPNVAGTGQATGYQLVEQPLLGFVATLGGTSQFDLTSRQEIVWQAGAAGLDLTDPDELRREVLDTQGRLLFGNVAPGSIHGFKFEDFNGNRIFEEPNDFGQVGVTFLLEGIDSRGNGFSNANGTALEMTTDADGEFMFVGLFPSIAGQPSSVPGVLQTGYTITEVVPTGFVPTTLPLARTLDLASRQEFVWAGGAARLPAAPVEAVDQSLPVPNGFGPGTLAASGGIVAIQTFTPAVSGTITNLQVPITTSATVSSDVTVTIHTVNSLGEPTDNVLATATISAANVPIGDNQPTNFAFNLPLVAGQQYAWAINSATPVGESVSVSDIGGNPYAGGNAFQANPGFLPGNVFPNTDIAFSTTMLPTADPRVEVLVDPDNSTLNEDLMWGNTLPGEIHGYKFNDVNGNGIVDLGNGTTPAETPLAGFTIQLRDATGNPVTDAEGAIVADVVTGADGQYSFVNLLPGTYFVREVQQDGFTQTTHDPQPYVITRGQVYVAQAGLAELDRNDPRSEIIDKCLIFGNVQTASIEGFKFNDDNADGLSAGDARFAGVTITLTGDINNDGSPDTLTTVTDVNGEYSFEGLFPGTYTISEVVPAGSVATTNLPVTVTVAAGGVADTTTNAGLAIGNTFLGAIHGYKFEDIDGDGVDTGEPRIGGVIITLVGDVDGDGDNDTLTMTTDNNGEYRFTGLFPGAYTVTETVPPGSVATTGTTANITLTSGEIEVGLAGQATAMGPLLVGQFAQTPNNALRFGNQYRGEIHGIKFEDLDADGVFDAIETGLDGFTIQLTDANGTLIATDTTDANGSYSFLDLPAGTYFVREVQQTGYTQTTHDPQPITITRGQIYVGRGDLEMTLAGDQREIIVDKCLLFGNTEQSSIHGFKFRDLDRDGVNDPTDQPQAGVTFRLTTGTGAAVIDLSGNVVGNSVTDANGQFEFTNLRPGTYIVTEVIPAGQQPTTGTVNRQFTVGYGEELEGITGQAGLQAGDPRDAVVVGTQLQYGNAPLLGEIHGHKFSDLDGDGVEDDEDFRLNGWTIQLTDGQGNNVVDAFGNPVSPVQTQSMDLNGDGNVTPNEVGLYSFENLLPGTYFITEVDQPGYEQTSRNPQPITITGGQVYVAQLEQAITNRNLDLDDAQTDDGFEEGRSIIVDSSLSFGNQLRGEITWEKRTKSGLLGGVIFTLTQTHSYDLETGLLNDILDRPITVADNLRPDVDMTFGEFAVHDLPLGRYTLVESFPVPGYDPDTTVVTFNLFPTTSVEGENGAPINALDQAGRFQASEHIFFNTWSKRAFVGSTFAARLDYLELINQPAQQDVGGIFGDALATAAVGGNLVLGEGETTIGLAARSGQSIQFPDAWTHNGVVAEGEQVMQVLSSGNKTLRVISDNPWQNVLNRFDVDGNGSVTAADALIGINRLNDSTGSTLASSEFAATDAVSYYDVNGDGQLTALDILQVINHLNEADSAPKQAEPVPVDASTAVATMANSATSSRFGIDQSIDSLATPETVNEEEVDGVLGDYSPIGSSSSLPNRDHVWPSETDEDDDLESMLALLGSDLGR